MRDLAYSLPHSVRAPELVHHYGPQVHLVACPLAWAQLAKLSAETTHQPEITRLVRRLYQQLLWHVVQTSWPTEQMTVRTRMANQSERGFWHGTVPRAQVQTVVVDIARAGTVPAQQVYDDVIELLDADFARQDHLSMARVTNAAGHVVGAELNAQKIGGAVAGATVLVPDPMGATGGTMVLACNLYKQQAGGPPKRVIAMHLIVTPEYLDHMRKMHPDVEIWAIRLDRGMSSATILDTIPGLYPGEERGLNERQYIIPGAGGMGELLNNTDG